MKTSLILGLLFVLLTSPTGTVQWSTDMGAATAQAKEEGKLILLNFSGSDWCGNCIRLEKVLFDSKEFSDFTEKELVLVNADFPMKKANKLSAEQTVKNEALAEKYNKKGVFPTVLIVDTKGNVVGRLTTPKESAEEYLKELSSYVR